MYQSETSLTAVLPASDYVDTAASERDTHTFREQSWQLVGVTDMLKNAGDYVADERMGVPILIRNHDGQLTALHNVCAHRHCQLVDQGCGHAEELKCPYHGWRYGADGRTRKLPGASNFPKFERDDYRLPQFSLEQVGSLVFAHLGGPNRSMDDQASWKTLFADRTDPKRWRFSFTDQLEYPCDWKIVVEGSLESYHLSEVHAETFGKDPGEENSDHELRDWGTTFSTTLRDDAFLTRLEERTIRYLTGSFDPTYRHVHVFPGVMASLTDSLSLIYQVYPTGNQTCALRVFGFTPRVTSSSPIKRSISAALRRTAEGLARKVLDEDAAIFPKIQAGMVAAASVPETGGRTVSSRIFGRCEERLHAFQTNWAELSQPS
ncbi:aromatic ring-hydroxylating dioxygenase subunit alpha [Rubripirellula amarantea]|uniref:2-halobenzoate 1,2-dioxygenase large subunit n=1 Tax=Rubripirellula amarantea TaxID=2527999 RepID=A0A5C5WFW7_9BACT|nr:aromatic ring-hydroxylating dioxygenase subunit alpha [Rubripirellula amarantea]MDA8743856.1 aromatic ring-hydroxylating dioxygenase subunit alpha [Rubripirellula amarantea]TWT49654.1 2-halobenzoate 1,2-dioxygenase large subunit [Rubripirellula amarantea]